MNSEVRVAFASDIHSIESVKRAAYMFTGRFSFDIRLEGGDIVCVASLISSEPADLDDFARRFRNAVLDQGLRERIASETEGVRNLILAQAFSKTGLQD